MTKDPKSTHYVVYYCERLRDGIEEGAKVIHRLDAAVEFAGEIKNGYTGVNTEVRLFEVGQEIPLEEVIIETPAPPVKKTMIRVKRKEKN